MKDIPSLADLFAPLALSKCFTPSTCPCGTKMAQMTHHSTGQISSHHSRVVMAVSPEG